MVELEFDAKILKVNANVRYWEDSSVNGVDDEDGKLIPFRKGDSWCPIIDIDDGSIVDWPKGTTANIHYKVCDDGVYTLVDEYDEEITSVEDYVPSIMCPCGDGYGDYIIMVIDGDGKIENWKVNLEEFTN